MFPSVCIGGATPSLYRGVLALTNTVLRLERAPWDVNLQIEFVSEERMRFINYYGRGLDKPTDVLTFTEATEESGALNALLFGSTCDPTHLAHLRDELVDIGTIYVCLGYMYRRCQLRPHASLPFLEYITAALVHAELHALGYVHNTADDMRTMIAREQRIGQELRALRRRFPHAFPPLDGLEYLREGQTQRAVF